LEPHFYKLLLTKVGLEDNPEFNEQFNVDAWPGQKESFAKLFAKKTQQQWCDLLEGSDACFAPVLNPDQAAQHPHMQARDVYLERNGHLESHPAPRFANAKNRQPGSAKHEPLETILEQWRS
jgi:crotonobetainyl-CoA:carnitine CoA-transferase CaiB-like acyl-CoA transferase